MKSLYLYVLMIYDINIYLYIIWGSTLQNCRKAKLVLNPVHLTSDVMFVIMKVIHRSYDFNSSIIVHNRS